MRVSNYMFAVFMKTIKCYICGRQRPATFVCSISFFNKEWIT